MSRFDDPNDRRQRSLTATARRLLDDTRHDRLRTRSGLLLVVLVYVASTVALAALWHFGGVFGGVAAIAAWCVAFVALRLAVRSQADLPDEVLDERMRTERDRAYLGAFRLVAGIVTIAAMAALFAVSVRSAPAQLTLDEDHVNGIFWVMLSLNLGAPSATLALEQRRCLDSTD
jgi:hypothetical protein